MNRITGDLSSGKEHLCMRFTNVNLWKEFDLWSALFEKLYEMGIKNEQTKTGKNRLLSFVVGNVQKAINGKENTENVEQGVK